MKKILIILFLINLNSWSNNLVLSNVTSSNSQITFDISWDNSWKTINGNHDAIWLFLKAKNANGNWIHININTGNFTNIDGIIATDNKGVFVKRTNFGSGTTSGTITLNYTATNLGFATEFKILGIEMVQIPQGAFYVGDGEGTADRFHKGNDINLPYHVTNSDVITIGNTANDIAVSGLFSAEIPDTYPTGFDAFYIMKYEISQEQYVTFLNTLTPLQQQNRTESDLTNISTTSRFVMTNTNLPHERNSIACNTNATYGNIIFYCDLNNNEIANENNDGQNVACNKLSFHDGLAYLDWCALRPMSDMEYEKSARGNGFPNANDYAFGGTTAQEGGTYTSLGITHNLITNSGLPNESVEDVGQNGLINYHGDYPIRVGAYATNTSTRIRASASAYGVLDLAGNLFEFTVETKSFGLSSLSNLANFQASVYGDGELDINGDDDLWSVLANVAINPDREKVHEVRLKGGAYGSNSVLTNFIGAYVSFNSSHIANTSHDNRISFGNTRGCR